jgi:Domain of unknown function (DUF5667)
VSGWDDNDPRALDRLEDLLDAYCDARLAPSAAGLARIRANILAEATAMAATSAAANRLHLVPPPPKSARRAVMSGFARRAAAIGFAASLTLGTTAAVLAAPPGSPFYNARVVLETLVLPAQPDARLEAHERLIKERIAEAEDAAARGDNVGLAAALLAYQAEVAAATADVGDDAARLAHLEDMLAKHTAVLTALEARVPEQTSIDNAIDASSKAIQKLQQRGGAGSHPTRPPQGGPGGNGGNGGAGGNGGNGSDEDGQGGGSQDNGQR